jgi:hypothetical protein
MLSLVRNMFLNQQQRTVAIGLGLRRVIALSVPQFARRDLRHRDAVHRDASREHGQATRIFSTPSSCTTPFEIQPITILQPWHARSDRDPG